MPDSLQMLADRLDENLVFFLVRPLPDWRHHGLHVCSRVAHACGMQLPSTLQAAVF